jgi:hypothetical protein
MSIGYVMIMRSNETASSLLGRTLDSLFDTKSFIKSELPRNDAGRWDGHGPREPQQAPHDEKCRLYERAITVSNGGLGSR